MFKKKIIIKMGLFSLVMMSNFSLLKSQTFATNLNNENSVNLNQNLDNINSILDDDDISQSLDSDISQILDDNISQILDKSISQILDQDLNDKNNVDFNFFNKKWSKFIDSNNITEFKSFLKVRTEKYIDVLRKNEYNIHKIFSILNLKNGKIEESYMDLVEFFNNEPNIQNQMYNIVSLKINYELLKLLKFIKLIYNKSYNNLIDMSQWNEIMYQINSLNNFKKNNYQNLESEDYYNIFIEIYNDLNNFSLINKFNNLDYINNANSEKLFILLDNNNNKSFNKLIAENFKYIDLNFMALFSIDSNMSSKLDVLKNYYFDNIRKYVYQIKQMLHTALIGKTAFAKMLNEDSKEKIKLINMLARIKIKYELAKFQFIQKNCSDQFLEYMQESTFSSVVDKWKKDMFYIYEQFLDQEKITSLNIDDYYNVFGFILNTDIIPNRDKILENKETLNVNSNVNDIESLCDMFNVLDEQSNKIIDNFNFVDFKLPKLLSESSDKHIDYDKNKIELYKIQYNYLKNLKPYEELIKRMLEYRKQSKDKFLNFIKIVPNKTKFGDFLSKTISKSVFDELIKIKIKYELKKLSFFENQYIPKEKTEGLAYINSLIKNFKSFMDNLNNRTELTSNLESFSNYTYYQILDHILTKDIIPNQDTLFKININNDYEHCFDIVDNVVNMFSFVNSNFKNNNFITMKKQDFNSLQRRHFGDLKKQYEKIKKISKIDDFKAIGKDQFMEILNNSEVQLEMRMLIKNKAEFEIEKFKFLKNNFSGKLNIKLSDYNFSMLLNEWQSIMFPLYKYNIDISKDSFYNIFYFILDNDILINIDKILIDESNDRIDDKLNLDNSYLKNEKDNIITTDKNYLKNESNYLDQFLDIKKLNEAMPNILFDNNDKVDNDKVDNDKVDNDKVDNDKVDNDKVDNDKVNNDKVNNGKADNNKVNNGKADNDKVDNNNNILNYLDDKSPYIAQGELSNVAKTIIDNFKFIDFDFQSMFVVEENDYQLNLLKEKYISNLSKNLDSINLILEKMSKSNNDNFKFRDFDKIKSKLKELIDYKIEYVLETYHFFVHYYSDQFKEISSIEEFKDKIKNWQSDMIDNNINTVLNNSLKESDYCEIFKFILNNDIIPNKNKILNINENHNVDDKENENVDNEEIEYNSDYCDDDVDNYYDIGM